jgi:hypothetical protein
MIEQWMQRIPGAAEIPADHAGRKADTHHGLFNGPAHGRLGHSRAHQCEILTTAGGVIYTSGPVPAGIKIGDRVKYRTGFDQLGIEALAIEVRPADPVAPVEPIEQAEVTEDKRSDAVSSPWFAPKRRGK